MRLFSKPAGTAPVVSLSFVFILSHGSPEGQCAACHGHASGSAPSAGYGASWNVPSSAGELLFDAARDGSADTLTVGSESQTQYVYEMGYLHSSARQAGTMTGAFAQDSDDRLIGTGPYSDEDISSSQTFGVGHVCQWTGVEWKCGCRDQACTENYWQLRTFDVGLGGGGGTGGAPGGTSGEGSGAAGISGTTTIPGLFNAATRGTGTGIAKAGQDGIIDLSTSECFHKPLANIFEYPDGTYRRPFIIKGSVGNTYDLRGVHIKANPLRFPILFDDPHNTCVVGPTVVGQQSRNLTWQEMKSGDKHNTLDGEPVAWENSTGKFILEGGWFDNMEDGVGMPADLVPDRSTTWSIRHTYFKWIRDDAIENDGCLSGDIQDSFFDGIWTFVSKAPSKPAREFIHETGTITVKDSIIRITCMPDPRNNRPDDCPTTQMQTGELWKGGGSCIMRVYMENVVILQEHNRGQPNWPSGTYKNVTLIWETGSFPSVPSGIKVTRSRDAYNAMRASWIKRHGCDSNATNCSFLHAANTVKTPPGNGKPYVVMSNKPVFIPLMTGGSVQWWTENVSQCTATGYCFTLIDPYGQRRIGIKQCDDFQQREQQHMYTISCKAPDGSAISDSDRLTWFNRESDSQKPGTPSNVTATSGAGKITLTWSESTDNFYVASYRVYRNGVWISNVSGRPEFVDTGVSKGTNHSYQVEAMDAFGNLSGRSASVSAAAQ